MATDPIGADLIATGIIAKLPAALAGLVGAFVRQILPPRRPWGQRVLEYIGGAALAVYAGPYAAVLVHQGTISGARLWGIDVAASLERSSSESLAGFLCGAFGLTVVELGFIVLRRFRASPGLPGGNPGPP